MPHTHGNTHISASLLARRQRRAFPAINKKSSETRHKTNVFQRLGALLCFCVLIRLLRRSARGQQHYKHIIELNVRGHRQTSGAFFCVCSRVLCPCGFLFMCVCVCVDMWFGVCAFPQRSLFVCPQFKWGHWEVCETQVGLLVSKQS